MTDNRKKRMSMLDNLAAAGAPAPPVSPMMATNRALRSARDAVESHTVWELDPNAIEDTRPEDRLDASDVTDLIDAIEANGQTVPILVRRHPTKPEKYLLVYGRRRLAAIRESQKVDKVRALVATMDDDAAVQAQVSENMARRDLSYIEKALFAHTLIETGFGTQKDVADVLTVTKSSVSMALAIVETIGPDLIRAIGPADGVGRPRWDNLAKGIEVAGISEKQLIDIAERMRTKAEWSEVLDGEVIADSSLAAFEAVQRAVDQLQPRMPKPRAKRSSPLQRGLKIDGRAAGKLKRTKRGLSIEIQDGGFADWLDRKAETVIEELHARYKSGAEE